MEQAGQYIYRMGEIEKKKPISSPKASTLPTVWDAVSVKHSRARPLLVCEEWVFVFFVESITLCFYILACSGTGDLRVPVRTACLRLSIHHFSMAI